MDKKKLIEELRRRAKDSAAANSKENLKFALETLNQSRNLFIGIATAALGFLSQSNLNIPYVIIKERLIISLFFGITSLALTFLLFLRRANYSVEIEEIYAVSNITEKDYEKMINKHTEIRPLLKKLNLLWYLSLLLLIVQGTLVIDALRFL